MLVDIFSSLENPISSIFKTQLSKTKFDKTTTRYEYSEVLSRQHVWLDRDLPLIYTHAYTHILFVFLSSCAIGSATVGSTSSQLRIFPRNQGGKAFTRGVFSSEKPSASTGQKRDLGIPKLLVLRERRGNCMYTKEPSRCLQGISPHSIGVYIWPS